MSVYNYPTIPANVVDGYALAIATGPPVSATVSNATNGAIMVATQFDAATYVAGNQSGADVVLTWIDNGGSDAPIEYIERSDDGGSSWGAIGSATGEDQTYTDSDVQEGTYLYRMRAGTAGIAARSPYSNTASVTVVGIIAATGSVDVQGANAGDLLGKTLTLNDGVHTPSVFEFTISGTPTVPGAIAINVGAYGDATTALIAAVNAVGASLAITASLLGGTEETTVFTNDALGAVGNTGPIPHTTTVAVYTGMSGGV